MGVLKINNKVFSKNGMIFSSEIPIHYFRVRKTEVESSNENKNRKHSVLINQQYIPVKDWYRENTAFFNHVRDIPTSEQIGIILKKQGFKRSETESEVVYS
jgi:plasmid maintenance system killer protein